MAGLEALKLQGDLVWRRAQIEQRLRLQKEALVVPNVIDHPQVGFSRGRPQTSSELLEPEHPRLCRA